MITEVIPIAMKKSELMAILDAHDDVRNSATPEGFDLELAINRFHSFLAALNKSLGSDLRSEAGGQVEDATFHSQVFLSDAEDDICFIRFSNFGDMVSVYSDNEIEHEVNELLMSLFEQHNYKYLPFAKVAIEYTGHNSGEIGIDTWWSRYFGWICHES